MHTLHHDLKWFHENGLYFFRVIPCNTFSPIYFTSTSLIIATIPNRRGILFRYQQSLSSPTNGNSLLYRNAVVLRVKSGSAIVCSLIPLIFPMGLECTPGCTSFLNKILLLVRCINVLQQLLMENIQRYYVVIVRDSHKPFLFTAFSQVVPCAPATIECP